MRMCLQNKFSCQNVKYTRYHVLGSVVEYIYTDVLVVNFRQQCHIVQRVKEDCAFVEVLSGNETQSLIVL